MALNTETVYAALAARLFTVPGLVTTSRRLRHVNDVPDTQQPAMFLAQGLQTPSYETGRATQWTLNATAWLYVKDPASAIPGQVFNTLLNGVRAALAFDNVMQNACTLGGLAMWVRLGTIETDEGTLGEQAIARIPITMLVMG